MTSWLSWVILMIIYNHCRLSPLIQYCREPPWPRSSVLGLRPPGLVFRILCLVDNVISFISPFSGGSPGPVQPICAQMWPKTPFISFVYLCLYHKLLSIILLHHQLQERVNGTRNQCRDDQWANDTHVRRMLILKCLISELLSSMRSRTIISQYSYILVLLEMK